jgi:hypothetical protein
MDWEQTIREMAEKGLIAIGNVKDGDQLIAKLKWRAYARNPVNWHEYVPDWLYWLEFTKLNSN